LGYVCGERRKSVGIIMRKPNKIDYGLPSSYRMFNLLDMVSKLVERILVGGLKKWEQEGMRDGQFRGRRGRSGMDGVGLLYKR